METGQRDMIENTIKRNEYSNLDGTPAEVSGKYFWIQFQCGPIAESGVNGVCMLEILQVMIDRLDGFERRWPREENRMSILKLKEAQLWLREKQRKRKAELENAGHS